MDLERLNKQEGDLKGYDCPICHNKGYIHIEKDGYEMVKQCKCMNIRKMLYLIDKSGLSKAISEKTFDSFKIENQWQQKMFDLAQEFLINKNKWLMLCGQSGCGKTHICTAVVGELLKQAIPTLYISWNDEVTKIKQNITNQSEYNFLIEKLKRIDVLYIDDLFQGEPTASDVKIFFSIIDYRYRNNLQTIISSELSLEDIIKIKESAGGRILEKCQNCYLCIEKDLKKNYRVKGL